MLSTRRHSTSILTRKEILENGFLASSSSHSPSSPVLSYYMDYSSASKPDTWELPMDLDNTASGSSLCVVKQEESLSSCVKTELHSLTQGTSDLSLVCFCKAHHGQATFELSGLPRELPMDLDNIASGSSLCVVKQVESLSSCVKTELHSLTQGTSDLSPGCIYKAHHGQATFELSGLPWEHPSRDGCLTNVVSQNTSTPCKKDKHYKPLESLLFKSSELVGDISVLGNVPAPRWDISAIKSFMDSSMSLDVSTEELRLLGCSKADTSSLETAMVIPLAWPGAFKKHPMLIHRSATQEAQPSDPDAVPVFLHQAL